MSELYYTFNKNMPLEPPTDRQKDIIIDVIKLSTQTDKEIFYRMIKEHYCFSEYTKIKEKNPEEAKEKSKKLREDNSYIPFKGTEGDEGIQFDMNEFPNELIHILYKYAIFLRNRDTTEEGNESENSFDYPSDEIELELN